MSDEPKLPPGVHTFLDASTAHITKKDNDILEAWGRRERTGSAPYRTIPHSYGWFVHVVDDDREEHEEAARKHGISLDFFVLQDYARRHGCWWINLDLGADPIPGLPTHEW